MDKNYQKVVNWLAPILQGYIEKNFYGKVTLEFKDGRVVLLREERTIMPPK